MAYNRRLHLEKVIEIQEIVINEKKRGSTQIWIYDTIIADRFKISYSTFNNYLSINAKKQLAELIEQPKLTTRKSKKEEFSMLKE